MMVEGGARHTKAPQLLPATMNPNSSWTSTPPAWGNKRRQWHSLLLCASLGWTHFIELASLISARWCPLLFKIFSWAVFSVNYSHSHEFWLSLLWCGSDNITSIIPFQLWLLWSRGGGNCLNLLACPFCPLSTWMSFPRRAQHSLLGWFCAVWLWCGERKKCSILVNSEEGSL